MVCRETLAQAAQDRDSGLHAGLPHVHLLEAPLQRAILLDVLSVLIQGSGTDATQLPTGQHRLEQVGGVHRAVRLAGADQEVHLIDEEHETALRPLHLLQHGLQTLLKLAPVLCPADEGAEIQRHNSGALEARGDVPLHNPGSQALDDAGLTHARLTDEDGVVLRAPGEHADCAADLVVSTDHGVQLPGLGGSHEVRAVLVQRVKVRVARGRGHPARAPDPLHGLLDGGRAVAGLGKDLPALLHHGQEEVRGAHVGVPPLPAQPLRLREGAAASVVGRDLLGRRADLWELPEAGLDRGLQLLEVSGDRLQHLHGQTVRV
mmetsp:Transcript_34890/g.108526  ORF Transcript_34890/g.108526 Transcript_34890/m.108526 type:complete len:319 (+) Transcript_34890:1992-2948(+)